MTIAQIIEATKAAPIVWAAINFDYQIDSVSVYVGATPVARSHYRHETERDIHEQNIGHASDVNYFLATLEDTHTVIKVEDDAVCNCSNPWCQV